MFGVYDNMLKNARISLGYTQKEMADLLGYDSVSSYNMIENQVTNPPVSVALQISHLLGIPVEEGFSYTRKFMK